MDTQRTTVVGVFNDRAAADRAVDDLQQAGFKRDQIGVVGPGGAEGAAGAHGGTGSHAGAGAIAGVVAGAGVGGLVGLGVLAGVIPVVGPAIAAGTLGTILLNAAGGAAIAGVAGALIGLGIPEEEARHYESEIKAGRFLVTVNAAGRNAEAWAVLRRHGATSYQERQATAASRTGTTTGTATAAASGQTMQLHEEQLHATKQPVQAGEVRVRKEVVTEHKTLEVPVQREEVVIERHPASGQASSSEIRPGQEVRIPVSEEQVRVEKDTVVREEVNVGKRKVQDTQQVSGTVRKEDVHVEKEGDVNVRGNAAGNKKSGGRKPRKGR